MRGTGEGKRGEGKKEREWRKTYNAMKTIKKKKMNCCGHGVFSNNKNANKDSMFTYVQVPIEAKREHQTHWSWRHRQL